MTSQNNKIPTNKYNDKYSSLTRPIKIFLPTQDKGEHKYHLFQWCTKYIIYTSFDKVKSISQSTKTMNISYGADKLHVLQTLSYDNVTTSFDRGYTLHEHYNDFGRINMNGRVYNPFQSTFLACWIRKIDELGLNSRNYK